MKVIPPYDTRQDGLLLHLREDAISTTIFAAQSLADGVQEPLSRVEIVTKTREIRSEPYQSAVYASGVCRQHLVIAIPTETAMKAKPVTREAAPLTISAIRAIIMVEVQVALHGLPRKKAQVLADGRARYGVITRHVALAIADVIP